MFYLFQLQFLILTFSRIHGYTYPGYSCTASGIPDYMGVSSPGSLNAGVNMAGTGRLYFIEHFDYSSQCCGIISSWTFNAAVTGTLELVVWRRVSGTQWKVSGKNRIYVSSIGEQTYDPSTSTVGDYRLSIIPGDYIGWYSLGNDIISYGSSTPKLTRVRTSVSHVSVGDVTDWSLYSVDSMDRGYAIKANIVTGSTPSFDTIGTLSIPDTANVGEAIHTLTINNTDQNDEIYIAVQSQSSGYFSFDTTTYEISPSYSYIPPGSYTMTFVMQDQCGDGDTVTATIVWSNYAVTIDNIPSGTSATVDEALDTQTTIHSIVTTDNSAGDFTYCYLGNDGVGPFVVEQNNVSVQTYDINVQDRPQFDYSSTPEYLLNVECTDGSTTATSTFTVFIRQNKVPYFTNTDWSVEVNAETTSIGTAVFNLTATDPENDNIYYSVSCNPTGCPFVLLDSGQLVTSDILIHNSHADYVLTVTVTDRRQTSSPSTIAVKINNINSKPVLNNVPTDLSVAENTGFGYSIYTFTASDDDDDDTLLMSMFFDPADGASIVTFYPSTGVLTTSTWNAIDYEELTSTSFTTTISVGDGKFFQTRTFNLIVENVNEAPEFLQKYYSTYQLEGDSMTTLPLPSYLFREPDGESVTFSMDCGADTGRFLINGSTGEVRYNHEYDLDTANIPTEVICILKITDPAGLSGTAELAINIEHNNEHDPQFTSTNFYFYVDSTEFIGEIIGQVYASESDGSDTDHGIFYYSLDQSSLSKSYFGISDDGRLYVKESLSDLYLGQVLIVPVTITDYDGRNQTINVTVEVPTFTTQPAQTFIEPVHSYITSPENMPMLIGGCTLVGVIIILSSWILLQFGRCPDICDKCRRSAQMEKLLEPEQSHPENPKRSKRIKDRRILDEMFGVENSAKASPGLHKITKHPINVDEMAGLRNSVNLSTDF